jgi:hypothetical protein
MELAQPNNQPRPLLPILKAGVLAATFATLFSAFAIELLTLLGPIGPTSYPSLWDIARAMLLLCAITVVSCGSFGFLAGIAGGTILYFRRGRIRSVKRLLLESSIAGLALGSAFPLFDAAVNSESLRSFRTWLSSAEFILCALGGLISALFCALAFRRRFVQ